MTKFILNVYAMAMLCCIAYVPKMAYGLISGSAFMTILFIPVLISLFVSFTAHVGSKFIIIHSIVVAIGIILMMTPVINGFLFNIMSFSHWFSYGCFLLMIAIGGSMTFNRR